MRFLRQSLTGLLLLSLTLGILAYAGVTLKQAVEARMARQARPPQAQERVFAVNLVRATQGEVAPVLTAYGEVRSRRTLDLRAAVGGEVVELSPGFVEGGQLAAGDLLLRVDPADAQAALERAESDVSDAAAEVRDAARALDLARDELKAAEDQASLRERAFKRAQSLRARGAGTDATVETAELGASAARAAVLSRRQAIAQAEARVDQAATRQTRAGIARDEAARTLAETELRAPFAGTLADVAVAQGRLLSKGEKLAQLIDEAALDVAFRLPTRDYANLLGDDGRLKPAPVRAFLDRLGDGLVAQGHIARDSAAVGEGLTGRLVFATLDRARGLKPGDFVTVEIDEAPLQGVIVLPAGALGSDGAVLALGEDDRLEAVAVDLLRRQGDDIILRAPNLAGREVVRTRTPLLGAGIKVKPVRIEAGAQAQADALVRIDLTPERRARLKAFVEGNQRMPADVKTRLLSELEKPQVRAQTVARLEARMGG